MPTADCKTCGRSFEVRRKRHLYCCPTCRLRAHAQKRLAGLRKILKWLQREIAHWESIAAGHRRKKS